MQDNDTLNFLPDDYVTARNRARANRLCGGLLAIVILSVATTFAFAEFSLKRLRAEHANISAEFDREADRLEQLDTLKKQQDAVSRRASLAEALVERTTRTTLINEVTSLLPDDTSLAEFTLASKVRERVKTPEEILAEKQASSNGKSFVLPPQPKRYDVSLKMAGLAYTDVQVAQFINRLARSPYFDDVNLLVSREFSRNGQVIRRFEVELAVRAEPLKKVGSDAVVSTEAQPLP